MNNTNTIEIIPKKIPLKIPLYEDPPFMKKDILINELNKRGINSEGRAQKLEALFLKAIVDEGLQQKIAVEDMDDRQPEKWIHAANLAMDIAQKTECNVKLRIESMERVNAWLIPRLNDRNTLINAATGIITVEEETFLFNTLLRFGAAMILEPIVETEMNKMFCAEDEYNKIRRSIHIFQMITGYQGIPDYILEQLK